MKVTRLPRSHKLLEKDTLGLRTDKMAQHTEAHGGKENWLLTLSSALGMHTGMHVQKSEIP